LRLLETVAFLFLEAFNLRNYQVHALFPGFGEDINRRGRRNVKERKGTGGRG